MTRKMLLIALLLVWVGSYAQELPKIIPPSPNAASLGKYGQVPVGLFTGTPQINIPLYTLKTGKLSVPIALHYSSNGIRVDQMPSNVGLGWSLQAGGVISRVIMDDADESLTAPVPNNFPTAHTQEVLDYLINATKSEDGYDTLSDIYSFNVSGYSGKFYLDTNRVPVLMNPSPVKIEKGVNPLYAFKITDPNGVIYWFGNENSTETTMYQHVGSGQHGWSLENPTSWYVSKITNTFGDEINFTYTKLNQLYYSGISQSVEKSAGSGHVYSPGQGIIQTRSNTSISQLSSITSNTGQIVFTYSAHTEEFNKLDAIEIKDPHGIRIKKFALGYENVTSSLLTLKNPHVTYFDEYSKRLFLTSVTEQGRGAISNPPYVLSYYNPDKIPPRFSYAQDYWGYYNGVTNNNYLVSDGDYFFESEENSNVLKHIFKAVGGDKSPNGNFSRNGMLKKITYPTGGFNELMYEPHSYIGTKTIYPPKIPKELNLINKPDQSSPPKTVTTETIPFTQRIVRLNLTTRRTNCWENGWPTHHIKASLSVKIADQGSTIFNVPTDNERPFIINQEGKKIYESGGLVVAENSDIQYFIDLQAGKRYQFTLGVPFECVGGDFYIEYYLEQPHKVPANLEVGGQRLQSVIVDDGKGKQEIKKYHYAELSDLNSSSGIAEQPIPSIAYSRRFGTSNGALIMNGSVVDILTLSSSNLYNLYSRAGHQIGYTSVIEELGNNFSGGATVHKFRVSPNIKPIPFGLSIGGTPFTTNFGTGELLEKQVVQKEGNSFKVLQKTTNTYHNNPVLNKEQPSYNVRLRDTYSGYNLETLAKSIGSFDIVKYFVKSKWRYIDKTITEEYLHNRENPVVTTTKYFYDNPDHLQATRTETTTSENDKVIVKTAYPQDIEIKTPAINKLITQHRIAEPIQTETIVQNSEGTIVSKEAQFNTFKDWDNNIVLPEFIKTLKGDLNLANPFENRIQYYKYDYKGNPLEVAKADGSHMVYIWGYQDVYPIAKIENATYADVIPYVADLKAKSNADIDHCKGAACKEQILRVALQNLRAALPNAMVSTYTYDPLIGVTSMTDPKGHTIYYTYDELNRLQYIVDNNDKIIERINYNYEGQNPDDYGGITFNITSSGGAVPGKPVTFATGNLGSDYLYTWLVNDNQEQCSNSNSFTRTFVNEGSYGITLIAYDTKKKRLLRSKPTRVFIRYTELTTPSITGNDVNVLKGTTTTYTASNVGGGSGNLRYEWYVNNVKQSGTATTLAYTPNTAGTYNVYFKVIDTISGKSVNSATRQLYVYNPLNTPGLSASKTYIVKGTTVNFSANGIGGGSGARLYEWYVNNVKQSTNLANFSKNFSGAGTYTIKFRVVDNTISGHYKENSVTVYSYHPMSVSVSPGSAHLNNTNPSETFRITGVSGGSGHYTKTQWKLWKMTHPSWTRNVGSGSSFTAGMGENGEYELSVTYMDSRTGQIVVKTMPITVRKTSGGDGGGGDPIGVQH